MPADLQYKIGLDGSQMDGVISRVTGGVGRLGAALGALGVTAFGVGFLKRGLEFNKNMNDSEAAIAKVLAQFQGLNDEAAKGEAAKAMAQLVELEPKAAGSLSTLVDGFLSTLAASQSAGLSVKQNIDLVGRFANALANANIPTEQLGQEMRSIITANIGVDSSLARILGITNEMITQAREAGNVYGFLTNKIGKLGEAGDTAGVAFSTLGSAVDKAAGALTRGLFDQVLEGSKGLSAAIDDNRSQIENLGAAIGSAARELVKFGSFAGEAFGQATRLAAIAGMMWEDGMSFDDAAQMVDALKDSREADAASAKKQAVAAKEAADAVANGINKEQEALTQKAAAVAAAKEATKHAGLDKSSTAGGGGEDPFDATERQIDARQRLADLKRRAAMEEMTTGQKLGLLSAELTRLAQEEADVRADPFGGSQDRLIEIETKRVELQREINALRRQEAREIQSAVNASKAFDVGANDPAAAEDGGRRRIRGFSRARGDRARLMGSPGGGGLAKFIRDQTEESAFEKLQRQPFGADSLAARGVKLIGGTARASRLMGQADAQSLSSRAATRVGNAVMPSAANGGGNATQAADPVLEELKKINTELTRIRTA